MYIIKTHHDERRNRYEVKRADGSSTGQFFATYDEAQDFMEALLKTTHPY